jgi:hypothetical protein
VCSSDLSVVRTIWRDPEANLEAAPTGDEAITNYYDDSSLLFGFAMNTVTHGA